MRRPEVLEHIAAMMKRMNIPHHLYCARPMPAYVEFSMVVNGQFFKLQLRFGIPQWELEQKLADIETSIILTRKGQTDIETWRHAPTASDSASNTESEIT